MEPRTTHPLLWIETDRLRLRPQSEDDAAFVSALMNDPAWLEYIGDRGVRTEHDARNYIRNGAMAMYDRHGYGLLLVELHDATPIGLCGLLQRDFLDNPDLGFALAAGFRGAGYAREASAAVIDAAISHRISPRLDAIVSPGNASSIALLRSLRFDYDREYVFPGNDVTHIYSRSLAGSTDSA